MRELSDRVVRASSLVENLNSRLRSYFSFPWKIAKLLDRRDGVGL